MLMLLLRDQERRTRGIIDATSKTSLMRVYLFVISSLFLPSNPLTRTIMVDLRDDIGYCTNY
jgi:hypothetical protein